MGCRLSASGLIWLRRWQNGYIYLHARIRFFIYFFFTGNSFSIVFFICLLVPFTSSYELINKVLWCDKGVILCFHFYIAESAVCQVSQRASGLHIILTLLVSEGLITLFLSLLEPITACLGVKLESLHIFRLGVEAGVPAESSHRDRKYMQTPHRGVPGLGILLLWDNSANCCATISPLCNCSSWIIHFSYFLYSS